jgi:DSF synthase
MQRSPRKTDINQPNAPVSAQVDNRASPAFGFALPSAADRRTLSTVKSRYCDITHDADTQALWLRLKQEAPIKFTSELIEDLCQVHLSVEAQLSGINSSPDGDRLRYQVFASRIPEIFSLGGDLALFRDCISSGDQHTLTRYAQAAVSLVHLTAQAYDHEVTTIALVQGQALGGGFEAALAAHVIVAERSAKMAFPEVLFNMFPGMGAYQFLCRRLSRREVEQVILSGRTYTALELHALGVVDVLAEDGQGEEAVRRYIRSHARQSHARKGFRRAIDIASPLSLSTLRQIADVWVETAMGLSTRDLDTIDYLLRAQQRQSQRIQDGLQTHPVLQKA